VCCSECLLCFYLYRVLGLALYFNQSPPPLLLPGLHSPRRGVGVGVGLLSLWLGWGSSASGGHLCVDGVCEAHVERVVVLHQRGLVVVEHQVLQAAVQVVRFCEAEAPSGAVDHTVLHLAFHTEDTEETEKTRSGV